MVKSELRMPDELARAASKAAAEAHMSRHAFILAATEAAVQTMSDNIPRLRLVLAGPGPVA